MYPIETPAGDPRRKTASFFRSHALTHFLLFLSLLFCGCSVQAAARIPSGARSYNGHSYYVYKDAASWSDAKKRCEKRGGHLVTFSSASENEMAFQLVQKAGSSNAWIGLFNKGTAASPNWCWVTGEAMSYTNWMDGEPNYDYDGAEKYGGFWGESGWNDYTNDDYAVGGFYVCEWDSGSAAKEGVTPVTGTYLDKGTKKVITSAASYTDSYFRTSSTKLQGQLARLSMLGASAAYESSYAKDFLKQCGFRTKRFNNKVTRTNNDHVSFTAGIRPLSDQTIVAVLIRGTHGNYEWVSNFNVGKSDTHAGFSAAEKELYQQLMKWLKKQKITGTLKFWITGHSRGAAVADLLAVRLNGMYGKANVYAYTFAAPRSSVSGKEKGCENIFNFLNPGDFVTEVAPKKWGYRHYGVDITLTNNKKSAMKKIFRRVTGTDYLGFGSSGKNSLLNAFLSYTGKSVTSYYKKQLHTNGLKYAPVEFCQKGLGYILAGEARGYANALAMAGTNPKANRVLVKMIIDGKINSKFAHAHTQAAYMSWLDAMYGTD